MSTYISVRPCLISSLHKREKISNHNMYNDNNSVQHIGSPQLTYHLPDRFWIALFTVQCDYFIILTQNSKKKYSKKKKKTIFIYGPDCPVNNKLISKNCDRISRGIRIFFLMSLLFFSEFHQSKSVENTCTLYRYYRHTAYAYPIPDTHSPFMHLSVDERTNLVTITGIIQHTN